MLDIDFEVSMIGADVFPHLTRLRCRHFDADSSAAFPKLAELIICGLKDEEKLPNMRLPCLKRFLIMSYIHHADLVREFILANAEILEILEIGGFSLGLDHAVVFPNLMKVYCHDVDDAGRCLFPALTHLTVASPVPPEFLCSLPDRMLSLEVDFRREKKDVVSAISKMRNLKSLKLTGIGWGEKDSTPGSIFENMHHLEEVRLNFSCDCITGDIMIGTLANQNPKLRHVSIYRIHLTDAALTSLAQLQHLTVVSLRISQSKKVPTAGVLTLLRGASRNVIRKFSVDGEKEDGNQLTREVRLMCEERGKTFDAPDTSRSIGHSFAYVFPV